MWLDTAEDLLLWEMLGRPLPLGDQLSVTGGP